MRRPPRWFWPLAFVLFCTAAALLFGYRLFEDLAGGRTHTAPRRLAEELVGALAAFALMPAVAAVARRFPLDRARWPRALPAHLVALLLYSAAHTLLLALAHGGLFPLLGLPADSYAPALAARAAQELSHDIIAYAAFVGLLITVDVARTRRERDLRHAQLERALVDAQLRTLRLQLQPHFLFNALNTISEAIYDDPRAADAMIGHLSELLRLALRTAPTQEVSLADELAALARYTAIMQARFGDRLRVRLDVAADTERALVPSLLLQPLVENVIRHAAVSGHPLEIDVRARLAGGSLVLEVADNGPGVDPGEDVLASGLGLASSAERLRLLYRGEADLEARNRDEGGFRVRMRLPARTAA
jgi:signal transduction histidine kinase